MSQSPKISLVGMSRAALTEFVENLGEAPFRAKQLWHELYVRGATSFESMTTLSKNFRSTLEEAATLARPEVVTDQQSVDGTRKWLLRFPDGQEVETVFIPDDERGTLCISSQVGCTLTCKFCHTGTQKWVRNLGAQEIVAQVMLARDCLDDWKNTDEERRRITNIVFMGMGEPLFNYDNVADAIRVLLDNEGISISKRKITLSTSGVVPLIGRVGEELGVSLAISLHAVTDALRDQIMPLNKKYPLAELMQACRDYPTLSNARRITFEYVMLAGVNDSDEDARALVKLLDGIPAKVNLIPFNPWPGSAYVCSDPERIADFAYIVMEAGYPAPVRRPRGSDILAACGQLKSESVRERKG